MTQSLPKTVGLDRDEMILLDALRKQRNVADYSGDPVPAAAAQECIVQAEKLHLRMQEWLNKEHAWFFKG